MAVQTLIARYGLPAIFAGSAIEGEPFALAGGVLAERGFLPFWLTVAAALAGSWLIDQIWFHFARRFRAIGLVRRLGRSATFARSLARLEAYPTWFILGSRFAYGVRHIAAAAIGFSKVRTRSYIPLDALAAGVWSLVFTTLGYLAGPMIGRLTQRYGAGAGVAALFLSISVFAISFGAVRRARGSPEIPATPLE